MSDRHHQMVVRIVRQRADLIDRYAAARRRHDRTRATALSLREATTALLKAELRAKVPARPARRRAPAADLFQEAFA